MTRARKWKRRFLAILLGLSVFPVAEVICRVAGWGDASVAADPFVGFAGIRPLFELNSDDGLFHVAANRRAFFADDTFAATKPVNGFRIFVLGGSTVQGRPYSVATSFTTNLELALVTAAPQRSWEVVNCGGVSYASYRLIPILQECLSYDPDLFIVCTGHNEFLEDVTYRDVRDAPTELATAYSWLTELNSYRLLASALEGPEGETTTPGGPVILPEEVDPLLDHQGGLAAYSRTELQRDAVVNQFQKNLQQIVETSTDARVPLLLLLPPSNLGDCPPFKSEFSANTSVATQQAIVADLKQATALLTAGNTDDAIRLLEQTAANDPHFALTWYQLGRALLAAGRKDDALAALTRARDEDICPLRMISALEAALRQTAADADTPLIELAPLLTNGIDGAILGDGPLVDHIHPSFVAHQTIAVAIANWMIDGGFVEVTEPDWVSVATDRFRDHLQSLDDLYFLRGRRALEALQGWAAGRARGPPLRREE